jgi:hypothetical protein
MPAGSMPADARRTHKWRPFYSPDFSGMRRRPAAIGEPAPSSQETSATTPTLPSLLVIIFSAYPRSAVIGPKNKTRFTVVMR